MSATNGGSGGMGSGVTNLGIESLTIGVSKAGLEQLLEELNRVVLLDVENEINNVDGVIQAINNCWQGEARDRFLGSFQAMRYNIHWDLEKEYVDLKGKFESLVSSMYEADKHGIYNDFSDWQ